MSSKLFYITNSHWRFLYVQCGFFKRRRDFGDYHKARRHKQASKVLADNADDKVLLN